MALFLTILFPLVGGVLLAFFPRQRGREIKLFSIFVAAATLVLSIVIFALYDYKDGGYQFTQSFTWLEEPINISLSLGLDGISAPMVLLTGIVMFAAVLVSWNTQHRPKDFFVLLMMLVAGVYGVFVVRDLFFLFFFYELAVLPMYLLIGVWGSSTDFGTFLRTKEYGAMKLVLYLVAGSVLVWVAILAVYWAASQSGHPTFFLEDLGNPELVNFNDSFTHFQTLFFPFFMVGFGVLAGPVAIPHLVSRRPRGGSHGGKHAPRWGTDEARGLRYHPCRHGTPARGSRYMDAGTYSPGHRKRPLRRHLGDGPAGPEVRHWLL